VTTGPGLRERKKARTRQAISDAAIALFLQRGYEQVSVTEIADAAEVSKRTLFVYFPSKDDLVLHRFADHVDEPARVVHNRRPGEAPLDALHQNLRAALDRRDPITGLCDDAEVVRFYRLVLDTPALTAATARYHTRSLDALTAALQDVASRDDLPPAASGELTAEIAASQILATLRTLAHANQVRIAAGRTADDLAPHAAAETDQAFEFLRTGIAPYRA
jgi:AcrR family transcriptional regulator